MCSVPNKFLVPLGELLLLNEELYQLKASHHELHMRILVSEYDFHYVLFSESLEHLLLIKTFLRLANVILCGRFD